MTFDQFPSIPNRTPRRLWKPLSILLLTLAGLAVMGYHPGFEDDGIYLSAVKANLNPALYPRDADFFRLQSQATVFPLFMAGFVRLTHVPVAWAELLWQFLSLYTILWAAHSIAQRLFPERSAQWAGVALLSAMFTVPVAGTALCLADQHLHPRNMATAAILLAVDRTLARKAPLAVALLLLALVVHPIMAAFGISFCIFLMLVFRDRFSWGVRGLEKNAEPETRGEDEHPSGAKAPRKFEAFAAQLKSCPVTKPAFSFRGIGAFAAAVLPGWIFEPPTPEWRRALATRTYYFLYQWTWYEWLGAIGPLLLLWILWRWESAEHHPSGAKARTPFGRFAARLTSCPFKTRFLIENGSDLSAQSREVSPLARFALALLLYGAFQQCIAMLLLAPASLIRVTPLQPMRYLHLEYVFLLLIAGGLLGRHVLGPSGWRWALFLLAANGGMFLSQRLLLPASEHLELPGRSSRNAWLQAFTWIRQNTPTNAYFALDPEYLSLPGEDYHSFRALAERSQIADAIKDTAVVTQVPELAPRWAEQVDAQAGWRQFQIADFERLKARFGVDWVLVSYPPPARLICIWHNDRLAVCRIPARISAPGP